MMVMKFLLRGGNNRSQSNLLIKRTHNHIVGSFAEGFMGELSQNWPLINKIILQGFCFTSTMSRSRNLYFKMQCLNVFSVFENQETLNSY